MMERYYTVKEMSELMEVSKPTVQRAINACSMVADREDGQRRYYCYEKFLNIFSTVKPDIDISTIPFLIKEPQNEPPHDADRTATPTQRPPHDAEQPSEPPQELQCDVEHNLVQPQEPPHEPEQTATPTQKPPHEAEGTATPTQEGELEFLRAMLSSIQGQLEVKDKQICFFEEQLAIKDRQIRDYSLRLAEAMQLTKGQQYITAADKVERLAGVQSSPDDESGVVLSGDPVEVNHSEEPPQKKSFWKRIFG